MEQIVLKNNRLGLKVYINGTPDISLMPKAEYSLLVSELELNVATLIEKKRKRKPYTRDKPK